MNSFYFDKVVAQIIANNLDAMLIAPSADLSFLLGHSPLFCLRFQGLFITKYGEYFYVCNLLSAEEMQEILPNKKVYSWFDGDGFLRTTQKALEDHHLIGKRIGVNNAVRAFNLLEIGQAMDITFVSARDLCSEVRICKTDDELMNMQKAVDIAVDAMKKTIPEIRAGITEKQVQEILVVNMLALGAERASALVASGPNSGFAHYNKNDRTLQEGDTVLIDYAGIYQGMLSDITRTFFLGKPSGRQAHVYGLVQKAIESAEDALKNGERWIPNIDAAARDVITDGGYGQYFTTRLGHGIGFMPHEAPDIKKNNERMLEPRMAFTIEPGIYIGNDFGVRIEDCIAIAPNGDVCILSEGLTKDCIVIENSASSKKG